MASSTTYGDWMRPIAGGIRNIGKPLTFAGLGVLVVTLMLSMVNVVAAIATAVIGIGTIAVLAVRDREHRNVLDRTVERRSWLSESRKGRALYRSGMLAPVESGQCRLPGILSRVSLVEANDGFGNRLTLVRHGHTGEYSLLFACQPQGAALADDDVEDAYVASWAGLLEALGGEAGIGVMALSPRAVARLDCYRPDRPVPKVLRITDGKGFDRALADGVAMNTFSILTIEDWIDALDWAEGVGGLDELIRRTDANYAALADWVARTDWIDFLPERPEIRSTTSVCLKFVDPRVTGLDDKGQKAFVTRFKALLEGEGAVFDMEPHRNAPPGLRLWCGCTVETADVMAATPWLEWAFERAVSEV